MQARHRQRPAQGHGLDENCTKRWELAPAVEKLGYAAVDLPFLKIGRSVHGESDCGSCDQNRRFSCVIASFQKLAQLSASTGQPHGNGRAVEMQNVSDLLHGEALIVIQRQHLRQRRGKLQQRLVNGGGLIGQQNGRRNKLFITGRTFPLPAAQKIIAATCRDGHHPRPKLISALQRIRLLVGLNDGCGNSVLRVLRISHNAQCQPKQIHTLCP